MSKIVLEYLQLPAGVYVLSKFDKDYHSPEEYKVMEMLEGENRGMRRTMKSGRIVVCVG